MFLNQLLRVSIPLSYDYNDIFVKRLLISDVLISAVQPSDSVVCACPLFYIFLAMVCHSIWSVVPCAAQQDLFVHPA